MALLLPRKERRRKRKAGLFLTRPPHPPAQPQHFWGVNKCPKRHELPQQACLEFTALQEGWKPAKDDHKLCNTKLSALQDSLSQITDQDNSSCNSSSWVPPVSPTAPTPEQPFVSYLLTWHTRVHPGCGSWWGWGSCRRGPGVGGRRW